MTRGPQGAQIDNRVQAVGHLQNYLETDKTKRTHAKPWTDQQHRMLAQKHKRATYSRSH